MGLFLIQIVIGCAMITGGIFLRSAFNDPGKKVRNALLWIGNLGMIVMAIVYYFEHN